MNVDECGICIHLYSIITMPYVASTSHRHRPRGGWHFTHEISRIKKKQKKAKCATTPTFCLNLLRLSKVPLAEPLSLSCQAIENPPPLDEAAGTAHEGAWKHYEELRDHFMAVRVKRMLLLYTYQVLSFAGICPSPACPVRMCLLHLLAPCVAPVGWHPGLWQP